MLTRDDHLSFALEYVRRAIDADLHGNVAHGDELRAKANFHFNKANA